MDWYGVLFGAVAAWQPGESSIANYQDAYGAIFHRDPSGKINAAEKELMAAQEASANAKTGMNSDELFWIDPWSAQGQDASAKLLPQCAGSAPACRTTPSCCWRKRGRTNPKLA